MAKQGQIKQIGSSTSDEAEKEFASSGVEGKKGPQTNKEDETNG